MNSRASEIFEDFVSLFFPRYCLGCEESLVKGEELICSKCILEMPNTNYHLEPENPFYRKLNSRIAVKYVMSQFSFTKGGRVQHLLHALKYKNKPELGRMLGRVYGHQLCEYGYNNEFDLILPVPLHQIKKKRRGYNQSEEFGLGLSEILNIPCSDSHLQRLEMTTTQTRKSRLKRWENVKEVFALTNKDAVTGKRVLLVDDVVTTGATLEAVGQVLLRGGCRELSIGCIAATQ